VPPKDVVRHDPDDPYLVVAADKGNGDLLGHRERDLARIRLLARRRVRLGRQRRLRPQEDGHHRARRLGKRQAPLPRDGRRHADADFTVVGIGDMSGDVFGNGMLLSGTSARRRVRPPPHLPRPAPDPGASYAERERLFNLPRSSWDDYDRKLILAGRRHLRAHAEVDS
jgi:glutamate dehydrogenase